MLHKNKMTSCEISFQACIIYFHIVEHKYINIFRYIRVFARQRLYGPLVTLNCLRRYKRSQSSPFISNENIIKAGFMRQTNQISRNKCRLSSTLEANTHELNAGE